MQREKMVGGNLHREGMEVALEHWTERYDSVLSRLQRFSPVTGKAYRMVITQSRRNKCRIYSESRWYHGRIVRPKRKLKADFFVCVCKKIRRHDYAKTL